MNYILYIYFRVELNSGGKIVAIIASIELKCIQKI